MRFHSAQQHEYALPHLPEICRKPQKYGYLYILDTQRGPRGVQIRVVPLYSSTHPMETDVITVMWYMIHIMT